MCAGKLLMSSAFAGDALVPNIAKHSSHCVF